MGGGKEGHWSRRAEGQQVAQGCLGCGPAQPLAAQPVEQDRILIGAPSSVDQQWHDSVISYQGLGTGDSRRCADYKWADDCRCRVDDTPSGGYETLSDVGQSSAEMSADALESNFATKTSMHRSTAAQRNGKPAQWVAASNGTRCN